MAPNKGPPTPYSWSNPHRAPQGTQLNAFSRSTKHVDQLGKLPRTLEYPAEGVELVQCSMARTKTTLLLLKPRFDYRPDSPLQYRGVVRDTREAEEYHPPIVGTHPPVNVLMKEDHHPGLPVQTHCPRPPRNVVVVVCV
ncbi:hypothetical protein ATANTOWER_012819 [Ataeniobius toweri]|uniref:Uncharacterized protein n=1 Tax=Ataeniobius toweri TaxID=208326 RepID=A0ABU7AF94_9TELE|nr:hypothetical protein [Ataeniobius toweri]